MSNIASLKRDFLKSVEDVDRSEYEARFFLLLKEKFNYSRLDFLQDKKLAESDYLKFQLDLKLLQSGQPVQYLIGHLNFAGLNLKTDERALIPRPETEELVGLIRKLKPKAQRALDLATGSGCIALALARDIPEVFAVEKSEKALALAKENQALTGLPVQFISDDILKPLKKWPGQMDIIVSNPPYVRQLEKKAMLKEVYDFEPEMALFVPDSDPLQFYRSITKYAFRALNEDGLLAFEINRYLFVEMRALLEGYFAEVQIISDHFDFPRFALATKKRPTEEVGP